MMKLFKKEDRDILGYAKRDGQDFLEKLDLREYIDRSVEMRCAEIAAALSPEAYSRLYSVAVEN